MPESEPELQSEEFRTNGAPEYLIINDLGDRVTFQCFTGHESLSVSETRGYQSERLVTEIALKWGFPENIYFPKVIAKGNSSREIGDLILVSGDDALIVQVKSRNSDADEVSNIERWIRREAKKAINQGRGSIRALRQGTEAFVNGRQVRLSLPGNQMKMAVLVVLDVDRVPENIRFELDHDDVVLIITSREYEFLFQHLKSVCALIRYVFRVCTMSPVELGSEMERYMSLAIADDEANNEKYDVEEKPNIYRWKLPLLPIEPTGVLDEEAFSFFRDICEIIGLYSIETGIDPAVTRRVFGAIDALPVQAREMLGRYLADGLVGVQSRVSSQTGMAWLFRFVLMDDVGMRFVFGVSNKFDQKRTNEIFQSRVRITHHHLQSEKPSIEGKMSVGILVTPRDTWPHFDVSLAAVDDEQNLSINDYKNLIDFWSLFGSLGGGPIM